MKKLMTEEEYAKFWDTRLLIRDLLLRISNTQNGKENRIAMKLRRTQRELQALMYAYRQYEEDQDIE
jgi:hypothetical protein